MIVISKPKIHNTCNNAYLKAEIAADYFKNGGVKEIYFSVEEKYADFLVDEVCDSFLLAALLPAVVHGEDIEIRGKVSEKLLFHARYTLLYILAKSYNGKNITIRTEGTSTTNYQGVGVGCGCSLGIDSLSAIFTHLHTPELKDYQITHLTYFNVGSHGYKDAEANRRSYLKDMVAVEKFAEEVNLPLVKIESNIWEIFSGFNFDQSGNIINMSTVLSVQKLFGKYLYGSNYPISEVRLTNQCSGYFESLMIPLCSTESTELIVANGNLARSDKTEIVVKYPLSYNSLYVCWKELIVNNNPNHLIAKIKDAYLNCTRCDKCLRTCAQLEILGELDKYENIFDLNYYYKVRNRYMGKVLAYKSSNAFYRDIINMAKKYDFHIPFKSKVIAFAYSTHLMGLFFRVKKLFS